MRVRQEHLSKAPSEKILPKRHANLFQGSRIGSVLADLGILAMLNPCAVCDHEERNGLGGWANGNEIARRLSLCTLLVYFAFVS